MIAPRLTYARTLLLALRFALLVPGYGEPPMGDSRLVQMMVWTLFAVFALVEAIYASFNYPRFEPLGIFCLYGLVALITTATGQRSAPEKRLETQAIVLGLYVYAGLLWLGLALSSDYYAATILARFGTTSQSVTNFAIAIAIAVWLAFAIRRAICWLEGESGWAQTSRAFIAVANIAACFYVLPFTWIFDFDGHEPLKNTAYAFMLPTEPAANAPPSRYTILRRQLAALELAQAPLLAKSLDDLEPRDPTTANVFALGLAGDFMGDEFPRELNSGLKILGEHFGTAGHTVKLINHLDFVSRYPVASRQNFSSAVGGIVQRMDRDKDLFVLFMTSHGSQAGLYLDMDNLSWGSLTPQTVKAVLDMYGVKNRVIIISACHAGVFVPELKGDHTAIIAAAAADRTSFGCSSENDWTYFGDALFNKGFALHDNFPEAFYAGRRSVTEREIEEGITPSLPQISIGNALSSDFPKLFPADKIEIGSATTPASQATN